MTPAQKATALGRIMGTTSYEDLKPAEVVIEAASEDFGLKTKILKQVDRLIGAAALVVSNTSSVSITKLASAMSHPDRFAGMHFFNPVPVMALVEIVRGLQTSDATHDAVRAPAVQLGKSPITVKSAPGFVVNRLLLPMINEAFFVLAEGDASAAEHRRGHEARLQSPDGPVGAGRPDRPRCVAGGHADHSRRVG